MSIDVIASTGALGAEVLGVDLRAPLERKVIDRLEAALLEHGVLVFRAQALEARELTAFARCFGPIQPHVQRAYQHPEVSEVVMMTNRTPDGRFDEVGARRGAIENTRDGWHSDLSYDPIPAKATLLHGVEIPSRGGNTCFSNASLAFESLPDHLKAGLVGLRAEFVYGGHDRNRSARIAASALDAQGQASTHAVHPVVNAHPVTATPAIYANPLITTRILDVSHEESERILESLFDALDRQELRFEHEWRVGDTLLWDNRGGTMHTGRLDYPRHEARRFLRTTVSGVATIPYRGQGFVISKG